ncbi:MAG: hypothetical protein A2W90_15115 [Bacteroidetes bacterium GWF2_42_66]|nr:MAG: hypothetical protein A2W92_15350 [Bacteroidetes bacterium GWA2_42_15]OFX99796.1 MAG: hypothetical protein A2W89_07115 [Bacteroidetes bacterium GWE2_42_39]OFY46640.1 MAG: hypothetical protein A2W90_15115 [Bacteroidetes bacterium GWF2_42_66]HBL74765.1 9-O-acetylesterase [Prolixibacteraceae bacterium]HCR90968.1 9-O-acetylesterase [Prolixibacteraceae bacterium]
MKRRYVIKTIVPLVILLLTMGSSGRVMAEVRPAKIFTSNMVLQKGIENTIWGWAAKNEAVSISLNGKTVKTRAGNNGKWSAKLPSMEYGGPYTLTIKGENTVELGNVMIGEVWICSGQSNMQWSVKNSNNAEEEIAAANYPGIRLFQVPMIVSQHPLEDISGGEWKICSPETVPGFSAVGYFFGRELHQKLDVAVGIIQSAWGGTVAETWISAQTIRNDPDFAGKLEEMKSKDVLREAEQNKERIKELLGSEISKKDIGIVDGQPVWAMPTFDDSNWRSLTVPKIWDEQGFENIDGIAYYRCTINLSEEQSRNNATLHLGKVDDRDITWMNGVEIGKTNGPSSQSRIYPVEANSLRPGKNILTVRVTDKGGKGGIWGDAKEQFLLIGNEKIDISGEWKFRFAQPVVMETNLPNKYPCLLFNAMINPILPYGIKGAIWYQGESNADRAVQYQRLFPSLIADWRNHWQLGDFPFLWVQLANFMKPDEQPSESRWAELREAQTMTLKLPNTGMASAIDIGEANDIHPRNKQEVSCRLSLNALKIAYGKNLVHQGPMFSAIDFRDGKAVVSFSDTGNGLVVKDRYGYIKGFALAGSDKKYYWAQARIVTSHQVEVFCDQVPEPVSVRYGWANNPDDLNLYNSEGLPANPFRQGKN